MSDHKITITVDSSQAIAEVERLQKLLDDTTARYGDPVKLGKKDRPTLNDRLVEIAAATEAEIQRIVGLFRVEIKGNQVVWSAKPKTPKGGL